jgi:hypothetical protein
LYQTFGLYIGKFAETGTDSLLRRADSVVAIGSIFNPLSVPVKLIIPPIPASMSKIKTVLAKKKETLKGWSVGISGRTRGGIVLNTMYCGYINGKGAACYYPPSPSFNTIAMGVLDEKKNRYGHAIKYGNLERDGGVCFDLALTNSSGSAEEIELSAAGYGNVPGNGVRISFFDPATGLMSEAEKGLRVVVENGACEYRKLLVGSDVYLAEAIAGRTFYRLALIGAYPNPFRRNLRIQYSIPDKNLRQLDFSIVDLSGREIWRQVLTSDALTSGLGIVAWNGKGKDKCPAASGLYMVRMTAIDMKGKNSGVFEKRITYMP